MQKIGVYLILLVTGALIGVSFVSYFTLNQNSTITEQVKVTIQGIDYTSEDSVLKIELLNNVPEKNLDGTIIISQDGNQWKNDVNWHYSGLGEAEILCNLIDENKSFRISYNENNPKVTYLDRIIDWIEVTISPQGSSTSQAGAILTVENVRFYTDSGTDYIEVILRNSGRADAKIVDVYAGTSSSALTIQSSVTYNPSTQMVSGGSSLSVTVQYDWTEGTRYYFKMVTEAGQTLPFSELA